MWLGQATVAPGSGVQPALVPGLVGGTTLYRPIIMVVVPGAHQLACATCGS